MCERAACSSKCPNVDSKLNHIPHQVMLSYEIELVFKRQRNLANNEIFKRLSLHMLSRLAKQLKGKRSKAFESHLSYLTIYHEM